MVLLPSVSGGLHPSMLSHCRTNELQLTLGSTELLIQQRRKKMEQYLTLVVAVAKIVTWHRPCWISSCSSMKVWDHRWVFEVKMTVKFGVSPSDWSYMSSFLQQSLTLLTCLVMCLPLLVWSLKYVFGVWDVDCWLAYFWQPHYPLSHFTAKSRRKKES